MTDRSIVTLNQVKSYLKINVSSTDHDDFLNGVDPTVLGMISLVSGEFESETGMYVQPYGVEEFLSGSGGYELRVTYWPVIQLFGDGAVQLDNLQYRTSIVSGWVNLCTDANYIRLDPREPWKIKILEGHNNFPKGETNIRVKYVAGYSSIPSDITLGVLERIAVKYLESKHGEARLGIDSQGAGGAISQNSSFTDHQKRWDALIAKYRKWQ